MFGDHLQPLTVQITAHRTAWWEQVVLEWSEHFRVLTPESIMISGTNCLSNPPNSFGFLGSSKRRRKEELLGKPFRRPQHELDSNGLVPLPVKVCFSCNRSELPDYPINSDIHTNITHTKSFWPSPGLLVFRLSGAVGLLHLSSVTIVPFCSTWTVWTLHSQLYLLANGCVQTMWSTWW